MAKNTTQNPDGFDVPVGVTKALADWVKRIKAREQLGYLAGEFVEYRIDDVDYIDYLGSDITAVYATIEFGKREDHCGSLNWEEVQVYKSGPDWVVEPL